MMSIDYDRGKAVLDILRNLDYEVYTMEDTSYTAMLEVIGEMALRIEKLEKELKESKV